ncbi:Lipid A export ATP-binding/permease protein MsbA [Roseivivax jejudonensis]|uniref:Lipid A export ATP-binding/permease protein MsbA n=1 Tax=Roseivivax jejudonensis TaxID=1529041 RepID=A0A1X7AAW9_9RHOB|nr:ABC transporter ATP-binding protein [Roseivivax jejudonensis]SLN74300.1 Lipid A export ATP-binding/permease protein MsbA [Roseivivax jejudonensis]
MTRDPLGEDAPDTSARERARLFAWLWRHYLQPHWPLILLAVTFMAIEGAMFGALSYMMKPMFDRVFVGGNAEYVPLVALAFFGIFALRAVASVIQKVVLSKVSQETVSALRVDMIRHMMTLDGSFHQSFSPGYLMQRVEGDVGSITKVWRALITGAGRDVIALVSLFGVAFAIDWRWTLVALIGAPLLVAPALFLQRFVRGNARAARDVAAGLSTRLNEILHGIVPVKLNTLERYQAERYRNLTRRRIRTEVRSSAGQASIPGLIDIMSGLGFAGVLLYGGGEILSGDKTVGDFMAFFTAIGLAFEPLRRLGAVSGVLQVAAAGLERIKQIFDLRPEIADPASPRDVPDGVPDVVLEDVHAAYGDAAVLEGVNLTAKAGEITALVGPSGAGKSTVFNLLTRLVDPHAGRVSIGGVGVDEMRLKDLRRLFSVVSQDALLFDETLRENIVLGRTDIDDDRLQSALEAAHVTDFLPRLPHGLETQVGARGSNLSGGQRQRVAIARALLRDTPILLLDEATSALDAASEAVVQDALDRLARGRTTLVIAHRLSTIRDADKIVVMKDGRVVEEGTHESLLARRGVYADLHRLQSEDG